VFFRTGGQWDTDPSESRPACSESGQGPRARPHHWYVRASFVVQPPVQQVSYAAWVAFGELPTLHFGEEQLKHARVAQTAEQRTRNA
jgi:hypothetical protein